MLLLSDVLRWLFGWGCCCQRSSRIQLIFFFFFLFLIIIVVVIVVGVVSVVPQRTTETASIMATTTAAAATTTTTFGEGSSRSSSRRRKNVVASPCHFVLLPCLPACLPSNDNVSWWKTPDRNYVNSLAPPFRSLLVGQYYSVAPIGSTLLRSPTQGQSTALGAPGYSDDGQWSDPRHCHYSCFV